MPRPLIRVDLSASARHFRHVTVQPGVFLLDKASVHSRLVQKWLGPLAAQEAWDGETVMFFVRGADGALPEIVDCRPATAAELRGRLHPKLEQIQVALQKAQPQTASERNLHRIISALLQEQIDRLDAEDPSSAFFVYRDDRRHQRLAWCWGYRPAGPAPASAVVCSDAGCLLLSLVGPETAAACARCGRALGRTRKSAKRAVVLLAILLLALLGASLYAWRKASLEQPLAQVAEAKNSPEPKPEGPPPKEPIAVATSKTAANALETRAGASPVAKNEKRPIREEKAPVKVPEPIIVERPREVVQPVARKAGPSVEFFGIRAEAGSVGFVVDCSGSMSGQRLERTKAELLESLLALDPSQTFYIVFFNGGPIPMSGQPRSPVSARPLEKVRAFKWVQGIMADDGTEPESSVQMVGQMKPNVIYLLSDGEFGAFSPGTIGSLRADKITVHTVAFEDESGAQRLREIAQQTGGTYRFVPPGDLPPHHELMLATRLAVLLIGALADAPPSDRQQLRQALSELCDRQDFGPDPNASRSEAKQAAEAWTTWWVENRLVPAFQNLSQDDLIKEFQNPLALRRRAALIAARAKNLDLPGPYIACLEDPDSQVRQAARAALIMLSGGEDHGPEPEATDVDRAKSVALWKAWWQRRKEKEAQAAAKALAEVKEKEQREKEQREQAEAKALAEAKEKEQRDRERREQAREKALAEARERQKRREQLNALSTASPDALRAAFAHADPEMRRAALAAARQRRLPNWDDYINALGDASPEVRQEARQCLADLAQGRANFGPRPGANDADWAAAAQQWKAWRKGQFERQSQQAAGDFTLANNALRSYRQSQLTDAESRDLVRRNFQKIIDAYPGTPAAHEAQQKLDLPELRGASTVSKP